MTVNTEAGCYILHDSWAENLVAHLLMGKPITVETIQILPAHICPLRQMTNYSIFSVVVACGRRDTGHKCKNSLSRERLVLIFHYLKRKVQKIIKTQ
jgi:hypothetical protein